MILEGEYVVEMEIFLFSNAGFLFGPTWWCNGCIVVP